MVHYCDAVYQTAVHYLTHIYQPEENPINFRFNQ